MRTYIKIVVFITFVFSVSTAFSADNQTDYDATKIRVNSVQSINGSIPSGGSLEPKGNIGYIISRMFDSNGKIGNWFLRALGTRTDGRVLRWSGGNGGQLINGSIYDNGTNVGIGAASGGAKLHVAGVLNAQGATIGGNVTGTQLVVEATNTAGSPATTTSMLLRGYEGRGKGIFIEDTGNTSEWFMGDRYGSNQFSIGYSASGGQAEYGTNSKFAINTNGNIGIGTVAPGSKLEIVGGDRNINETTPGTTKGSIHLEPASGTAHYGSSITFGSSDSSNAQAGIYTRTDGTYGTKMYLATTNSYAAGAKTGMMIDYNGNVGIGSTTPAYKLDVVGDVNFSGNLYQNGAVVDFAGKFIDGVDTDDAVYTTGSVGIGTTIPLGKLEIHGGGLSLYHNQTSAADIYTRYHVPGVRWWTLGPKANGDFWFSNSSNHQSLANLMIDIDGNVGIGTTDPGEKLEVEGNIKLSGSIIQEHNGNMGYIAQPTGGALHSISSAVTGAIKICLPTHGTADMLGFKVDVFDYTLNESVTVDIFGYLYQTTGGNEWTNTTAMIRAKQSGKDYNVRFGADGSHNCVWIGELASTWSYPQVIVRDFFAGYTSDIDAYDDGWVISFVTAFDTIDETSSSNFAYADWNKLKDKLTRTSHHTGGFIGSYNNVAANSAKTNPLYSIGSNYLPNDADLNNHYGIGYAHATNASFVPVTGGWGAYISADGDARIFLDASNGNVWASNAVKTSCVGNCY